MPQLSKLVMATCVAAASAQWGRKNKQQAAAPGSMGSMGDMGDLDGLPERNDVDRAMAGWEQLSQNPGKMKEVMESFKDPEVMAKAQEMLKDPQYMAAAKKKMEQLKAKAQANGMLDENGQPTAGFAGGDFEQAAQMMKAMGGPGAGAGGGAQAREWELDNVARHAAGEIDDAELGMANLKNAMKDPSVMGEMMQMMKDPDNIAAVKKMMDDPQFKAQAQRMAAKMKADGQLPDFSKVQQAAQAMAGGGGMGGMGGMGGGGDAAAAEIMRLRQENAALRNRMG